MMNGTVVEKSSNISLDKTAGITSPDRTASITSLDKTAEITSLDKASVTSLVTVIKWEINHLLARLSNYGIETFALSLDLMEGCVTELGSKTGLDFLSFTDCSNFKDEFLAFCRDVQKRSMDLEVSCDFRNRESTVEDMCNTFTNCHNRERKHPKRDYLQSHRHNKIHINGNINTLPELETSPLNCGENDIELKEIHGNSLKDVKTIVKSRRKRTPQKLSARDTEVSTAKKKNEIDCYLEHSDKYNGQSINFDHNLEENLPFEKVPPNDYDDITFAPNDVISDVIHGTGSKSQNVSHLDFGSSEKIPQKSSHISNSDNITEHTTFDLPSTMKSLHSENTSESVTMATVPSLQSVFPAVNLESFQPCVDKIEEITINNEVSKLVPNVDSGDTRSKNSFVAKTDSGKISVKSHRKTEQVNNKGPQKKGFKSVTVDEHSKETLLLNACRMPTGRYQCPLCKQQTRDRHDLKRHLRTHTKDKPFQCEICDKKFTRKWDLENHVARHMDKDFSNVELDSIHAVMSCKKSPVSYLPYSRLISDLLVKMNLENNMADSDESGIVGTSYVNDSAKSNIGLAQSSLTNEMESEVSNNSDTDFNSS